MQSPVMLVEILRKNSALMFVREEPIVFYDALGVLRNVGACVGHHLKNKHVYGKVGWRLLHNQLL